MPTTSGLCEPQRKGALSALGFCRTAINVLLLLFPACLWGWGLLGRGEHLPHTWAQACAATAGGLWPRDSPVALVSEASGNWVRKLCIGRAPPPPINSLRPLGPGPRAIACTGEPSPSLRSAPACYASSPLLVRNAAGRRSSLGSSRLRGPCYSMEWEGASERFSENPRMSAMQGASSSSVGVV